MPKLLIEFSHRNLPLCCCIYFNTTNTQFPCVFVAWKWIFACVCALSLESEKRRALTHSLVFYNLSARIVRRWYQINFRRAEQMWKVWQERVGGFHFKAQQPQSVMAVPAQKLRGRQMLSFVSVICHDAKTSTVRANISEKWKIDGHKLYSCCSSGRRWY